VRVIGILCLCISCMRSMAFASNDEVKSPQFWRSSEYGGVNALYCYLHVNGSKCEYSNLVEQQSREVGTGPCSLLTLMRLSVQNDMPLRAVSMTMNELDSCTKPIIVHMDSSTPEAGSFLLVLTITDKQINFFNGPSASIQSMSMEDFRRVWSGVALVPDMRRTKCAFLYLGGVFAGLIAAICVVNGIKFKSRNVLSPSCFI
jgi:hypothetical protein